MSLAKRRKPLVQDDSLERAAFLGWRFGRPVLGDVSSFLRRGSGGRPRLTGRWRRCCRGRAHDQQQASEAIRIPDLRVLDAEAARLDVGDHRLDAAALGVVQGRQITGIM